ncbi:MAG: hypothetical protein A2087_08445 [Spirochaetes bacterium GWD1_61_31]|nr:MAG: hypothetical protein A2Y37_03390 [Spirochaetes bacterium GWB1_60_80]OHD29650.1 MAG: hypothetical protein A2004_01930 [Spirochaetes bacterium GWC1_61_12]OHD34703.1 MAG: hypothetical protein A2087_08445 [Spirochaetes bacterium GWD1_61_31]OHD41935.1 MAG: hypothetical protein A2Y35_14295 [Spirochaetes bacterium GWE1_60_18]OHD61799.1 MAG: hypothetical protein A2Y32_13650 [Spirochaetes bacterium GWF1_60_12]
MLILGMYNHLPAGISDSVVEEVYQSCYRPFLSTLNRFPEISVTLHFSGSLLQRLEVRHPEFFMLLEELIGKRQIELLGGAFHEPILPLIPHSDRLGQIELLTTYLRKKFGKRSRGCWLNEYAWEPWLATTMQTCGIDYTFLLANQFDKAAIPVTTGRPVISEDQGRFVSIFPVHDCLLSWSEPRGLEQVAEGLLADNQTELATIMMPGELIARLWRQSGLESPDLLMEKTFAWFRRNALALETVTPSRLLKARHAIDRAYLPGTATKRFMISVNDGHFDYDKHHGSLRRALVAHPCAHLLYSKMAYVHILIGQLRGDKARKKTASEDLWIGQAADAFWHAPSGGIAVPAIRQAAWKGLLDAEQSTRPKANFKPGIINADIDFDGEKEFIYQGVDLNAYIRGADAAIFILELLKARRNLCDMYHPDPAATASLTGIGLDYLQALAEGQASPAARPVTIYQLIPTEKSTDSLVFQADSRLWGLSEFPSVQITKTYTFARKKIAIDYQFRNTGSQASQFTFRTAVNLAYLVEELQAIAIDATSYFASPGEATRPGLAQLPQPAVTAHAVSFLGLESCLSTRLNCRPDAQARITLPLPSDQTNPVQGIPVSLTWELHLPVDGSGEVHVELQLNP